MSKAFAKFMYKASRLSQRKPTRKFQNNVGNAAHRDNQVVMNCLTCSKGAPVYITLYIDARYVSANGCLYFCCLILV